VINLSVETTAAAENVGKLVAHAERACHAAQSLMHAIPVRLEATVNGTRVMS
jgi:hypothetical protein